MNDLKRKLHDMIDQLPENKVIFFVNIVADMQSMLTDDIDEFDAMISGQADEAVKRGDFISLDSVVKEMGFTR